MKKMMILLLCLLFILCSCAQTPGSTTNTDSVGSTGNTGSTGTSAPSGSTGIPEPSGSTGAPEPSGTKIIYVFDTVRTETVLNGSTTVSDTHYIYDENGFLSAIDAASGDSVIRTSVECNTLGLPTRLFDSTGNALSEMQYNAQGKLISTVASSNGQKVSTITYTYDAEGHPTKQETVHEMTGTTFTVLYYYENGLQVRSEHYQSGTLSTTTTMQYDDRGLCTESVQTGLDGTVLVRITYAYDAHGNQTESTHYVYTNSDPENPIVIRTYTTYQAIEVPADSPRNNL